MNHPAKQASSSLHLDNSPWKSDWSLPENVTYLNHGSFGPSPHCVQQERFRIAAELEEQPMQFFLREMEDRLDAAASVLATFVGAAAKDLVFVDNATFGMNIVAASVPLQTGEEVVLTDHEYGAVQRLWKRRARQSGAQVVTARLPFPPTDEETMLQAVWRAVTDKTRLLVVSHVTSPTAVVLPVEKICAEARRRNLPLCVDGPHALGLLPLDLRKLDCDFYTASCHKWLCGPFGSGFFYVSPRWQRRLQPAVVSWGGSLSARPPCWKDEFRWLGTRDPSAFLAVPAAVEFLRQKGSDLFRERGRQLAGEFSRRMETLTGLSPGTPPGLSAGSMNAVPLPDLNADPPAPGRRDPLQEALWQQFRIEIPVIHWQGQRLLRISCHLYNDRADLNRLLEALAHLLPRFSR